MVLKEDVATKKRLNSNRAKDCKSRSVICGRPKSASRGLSSSRDLTSAFFTTGPYTYVVRQPKEKKLSPDNFFKVAKSSRLRTEFGADSDKCDDINIDGRQGETPLWISPVLPQRHKKKEEEEEEEVVRFESSSSPQARPPGRFCSAVSDEQHVSRGGKKTASRDNRDSSNNNNRLLAKLLTKMQQCKDLHVSLPLTSDNNRPGGSPRDDKEDLHNAIHKKLQRQQRAKCNHGKCGFATNENSSAIKTYSEERASNNALMSGTRPPGDANSHNEDTAVLRSFTNYLKKKADRLQRSYDELFWATRSGPACQPTRCYQEPTERPFWGVHCLRGWTAVAAPSGGGGVVCGQTNEHPYYLGEKATHGRHERGAYTSKGVVSHRNCVDVPLVDTHRPIGDGGTETVKRLSPFLDRQKKDTKKTKCRRSTGDTQSFYTSQSLRAEVSENLKGFSEQHSPSLSSSSSFIVKENAVAFREIDNSAKQNEQLPPQKPKNGGEEAKENSSMVTGQDFGDKSLLKKTSFSGSSAKSQAHSAAYLNIFDPPSTHGLNDISAVTRLHEYSIELEEKLGQLINESGEVYGHGKYEKTTVAPIGATSEERKVVFPAKKTIEETKPAPNRRFCSIISPTPLSVSAPKFTAVPPHQSFEGDSVVYNNNDIYSANNSGDMSGRFVTSFAESVTSADHRVNSGKANSVGPQGFRSSAVTKAQESANVKHSVLSTGSSLLSPFLRSTSDQADLPLCATKSNNSSRTPPRAPFFRRSLRRVSPILDDTGPTITLCGGVNNDGRPPDPYNDRALTDGFRTPEAKMGTAGGAHDFSFGSAHIGVETITKGDVVPQADGGALKTTITDGSACGVLEADVEKDMSRERTLPPMTDTPISLLQRSEKGQLRKMRDLSSGRLSSALSLERAGSEAPYMCGDVANRPNDTYRTNGAVSVIYGCGSRNKNGDPPFFEFADECGQTRQECYTAEGRSRFSLGRQKNKSSVVSITTGARSSCGEAKRTNGISCTTNKTGFCGSFIAKKMVSAVSLEKNHNETLQRQAKSKIFVNVMNVGNGGKQKVSIDAAALAGQHPRRFAVSRSKH